MLTNLMNALGFKPKPKPKPKVQTYTVQTLQDAYETIRNHFLTQKVRATNQGVGCMYRAPGDLKCAIGVLIDDKHYNKSFESRGICSDPVRKAVEASTGLNLRDSTTMAFLSDAQLIHDAYNDTNLVDRVPELDRVAARLGLEVR